MYVHNYLKTCSINLQNYVDNRDIYSYIYIYLIGYIYIKNI